MKEVLQGVVAKALGFKEIAIIERKAAMLPLERYKRTKNGLRYKQYCKEAKDILGHFKTLEISIAKGKENLEYVFYIEDNTRATDKAEEIKVECDKAANFNHGIMEQLITIYNDMLVEFNKFGVACQQDPITASKISLEIQEVLAGAYSQLPEQLSNYMFNFKETIDTFRGEE